MRARELTPSLRRKLNKISKKDKNFYEQVLKKINEILCCEDVNHYKNLRNPLQDFKRVHIRGSFVLIFEYIEKEDKVVFSNIDHHDNIYR